MEHPAPSSSRTFAMKSSSRSNLSSAPLVTATGYSRSQARALAAVLRAKHIQFAEELLTGSTAIVVHKPFAALRSEKIREARRNGIPCVTHEWTTHGACATSAIEAFELRHAVRKQHIGVMGLSAEEAQHLHATCLCTCTHILTKECKVLVTPDPRTSTHYVPNQRKLDFARRHGIPCMTLSEFLLCYQPPLPYSAEARASWKRPRNKSDACLAPASLPPTPFLPDGRPSHNPGSMLSVLTNVAHDARAKHTPASQTMEPMTDVCVFAPTRDATTRNEVAVLAEAAGARMATSLADQSITHVVVGDADLTRSREDGALCFASGTVCARPGIQFVHLAWLIACVERRHRISCLPFTVRAGPLASGTARVPVLAFTTLSTEEMAWVRSLVRDARLPAVVQDVVYRRRPGHHTPSRSTGLHETTHIVAPRDRVGVSTKVKILAERFQGIPGGIPVVLVDTTWVTASAEAGTWLPCEPHCLPWPSSDRPVDVGPPTALDATTAAATPASPPLPLFVVQGTIPMAGHAVQEEEGVTLVGARHGLPHDDEEDAVKDQAGVAAAASAPAVPREPSPDRKRQRQEEVLTAASLAPEGPLDDEHEAPPHSSFREKGEGEEEARGGSVSDADGRVTPSSAQERPAATPTASLDRTAKPDEDDAPAGPASAWNEESEGDAPKEQLRVTHPAAAPAAAGQPCAGARPLERFDTETLGMSLQQRWEDMEAFITDAVAPAAGLPKTPDVPGPSILGLDEKACEDGREDDAPRAIPIPLPLAPPRRSPASLRASRPSDHNVPLESQQVIYDRRGSGGRREEAPPPSAETREEASAEQPALPPPVLFVEESLREQGDLVQRALEVHPHWQLAANVKECTHFVTGKLMSSVQFLCCVAAGKWVLQPSFLVAAAAAAAASGRPPPLASAPQARLRRVEEEAHQWTRDAAERQGFPRFEAKLAAGCALQRRAAMAAQPAPHTPFAHWHVTLTCSASRFASFKRVLESGGCTYVVAAAPAQLLEAVTQRGAKRPGTKRKSKAVDPAEDTQDGLERLILSDEKDWEMEQLEAFCAAAGAAAGPPVLLIDFILNYLCTQNRFEERDTVLHKKRRSCKSRSAS